MVSFIGAGPGDPELLTIRGKKIIDRADVIIYAGSLVNPQVLADVKEGAVIYNSATMNLDEVIHVFCINAGWIIMSSLSRKILSCTILVP